MSKTLLIDLNNLAIRNFFTTEIQPVEDPQYNLWKYEIFSQIYWTLVKFSASEVILGIDGSNSWRKLVFPRYKGHRKKERREDVDWDKLFSELTELHESIRHNIPFKVIQLNRAEADDVIGVLSSHLSNNIVIISNDHDYKQLCDNRIKVFNPTKKEHMELEEDKETFLRKLALKGQAKDNIFNVKTPSDYPDELRKPGFGDKSVEKVMDQNLDEFLERREHITKNYVDENEKEVEYNKCFTLKENYDRNRILIDFDYIPLRLRNTIINEYESYKLPNPESIYSFFKNRNWRGFLDEYQIVENTLLELY